MAKQVNVYGQFFAQGVELDVGQEHYWTWWGSPVDDRRSAWPVIKPSPAYPGEKRVEVTRVAEVVEEDGSRTIQYVVKNTGSNLVRYYEVYGFWTDGLPS